jgi:hypothetical protein
MKAVRAVVRAVLRAVLLFAFIVVSLMLLADPASAQISVTSANPSAAPQGSVNLNVTVGGSGFKKGAKAQWFVSGTTNPGGVTVNSTAFNGSNTLTANITVAADAVISGFDVVVTNADGRTGKGTELFAVSSKGTPVGCSTTGTPAGFTLVTALNPVQPNGAALLTGGALGNAIRVRPVDLNGDHVPDVLVAVVTSGQSAIEGTYAFLLDPNTGMPLANNPITGAPRQNPIPFPAGMTGTHLEVGDVNGDGVPDFLLGNVVQSAAFLLVGSVANNTLSFTTYKIAAPPNSPAYFGSSVALGDLDGDGADELVVGASAETSKGKGPAAAVYLYKYSSTSGVTLVKTISDPTGSNTSRFGYSAAIGNVAGDPNKDLAVGATVGTVYVFHGPVLQQTSFFTLTGPGSAFGWGVEIADVDHDNPSIPDLIVTNSPGSPLPAAMLYPGPVNASSTFTSSLQPSNGLINGWDWPNMDLGDVAGIGSVLVGAPNANNGTCNVYVGAVHLFLAPFASVQSTNYLFEPPIISKNGEGFGYGVAIANGYPFILVGAHAEDVGTTSGAGQVYVYRKN